jgi:hypothetical protein
MKRALFVFLFALAAALSAAAQELTIFDISDFVDPRELGASPHWGGFSCPCTSMLIGRALAGYDHDFADVHESQGDDAYFGSLAMSYYHGEWQVNVKGTDLFAADGIGQRRGNAGDLGLPRQTVALQLAHYQPIGSAVHPIGVTRIEVSTRATRVSTNELQIKQQQAFTTTSHRVAYDFGIEFDTQFKPFGHSLEGSLTYTMLSGDHPDLRGAVNRGRLAYLQRFPRIKLIPGRKITLDLAVSAGFTGRGLHAASLDHVNIHPTAQLAIPIGLGETFFNITYGPTYRRLGRQYESSINEIAFFVDRALFARSW